MDWKTVSEKMLEFYRVHRELHWQLMGFWKEHILFTWRWWLMAAMAVLPWPAWLAVRKRASSGRLLQAGLFVGLVSSVLDGFGISIGLWYYPAPLLPMTPEALPFNISVLPVVTMAFIQSFPKIKPVWKALIYAVSGALVFEQLMEMLGLYCDLVWKHYYSLPILFVLYLAADRLAMSPGFVPIRNTK